METLVHNLSLIALLSPLVGAIAAGIFGKELGRKASHVITIVGVAIACICSLYILKLIVLDGMPVYNANLYTWGESGTFHFEIGFLIDQLSAIMMSTVTFVSLLVHIYSIGYMEDDDGYQRFFSYMSLFTFAMLSLVMSNNFLLLFFGWEGVGLVSYLLIGFWFKKEEANQASLKAFLANRVGDLGFLLGIAAIMDSVGRIDYAGVFAKAPALAQAMTHLAVICPTTGCHTITLICVLLFVGAMGKSAQVPLHIWLPGSMEGPTPISALIHAATMVTAGVYMIARVSPLIEWSPVAQSMVLIVGATGALFLGIVGVVQHDIKRVIAYSTMSQLGYMMAANGASAFQAGMFHLVTHAMFKALLFLAAGSVIIGMHHEQDMRKMGGLRKYMPITYVTFLIGTLALVALPPFAGFYSKDAIIEAVKESTIYGADYAYIALLLGAFVTALYSFRAFFLTFHTKERMDAKTKSHLKESPWVVTLPLILLAIPSVILGAIMVGPALYGSLFGKTIYVAPHLNVLQEMSEHYHGPFMAILYAFMSPTFYFAIAGVVTAYLCYERYPHLPETISKRLGIVYRVVNEKYGFNWLTDKIVLGYQKTSNVLYRYADMVFIDHLFVNGSGRNVNRLSRVMRHLQSGYLYHYAFAMILGLLALLIWWVIR